MLVLELVLLVLVLMLLLLVLVLLVLELLLVVVVMVNQRVYPRMLYVPLLGRFLFLCVVLRGEHHKSRVCRYSKQQQLTEVQSVPLLLRKELSSDPTVSKPGGEREYLCAPPKI